MQTPRPYQETAINFLVKKKRAILGDSIGLGKTLSAVQASLIDRSPRPNLVVSPSYLKTQWEDYFLDVDPSLKTMLCEGSQGERVLLLDARADVFFVNYEMLSEPDHKYPQFWLRSWGTVIFDEAHRLRNRGSAWTKKAWRIQADRIFMLTGSPLVKDHGDFYPLLRLCDPDIFTSYWDFVNIHCDVRDGLYGKEIKGLLNPVRFAKMLGKYMLARTWEDVGIEMPPAVTKQIVVKLSESEAKELKRVKKEFRYIHPSLGEITLESAGAFVHACRLMAARSKVKQLALVDILSDHPEQVIIWCWYKETAALITALVRQTKRKVWTITGNVPSTDRHQMVQEFKNSRAGILIATIASLKEGENIQTSSVCIFYEMSYIAEDNKQCIGRQRRSGQTRPVIVYSLKGGSTLDMVVAKAQNERSIQTARTLLYKYFQDEPYEQIGYDD